MYSSTKIAIGFGFICFIIWSSYRFWSEYQLSHFDLKIIKPGRINLIAIQDDAGYQTIVSNQIIHLVHKDAKKLSTAYRLPFAQVLGSLNGDRSALSKLTYALHQKFDIIPSNLDKIWSRSQIIKALSGNLKLKTKLEEDLNLKPVENLLSHFNRFTNENSILIELPLKAKLITNKGLQTLQYKIYHRFQPPLLKDLNKPSISQLSLPKENLSWNYKKHVLDTQKKQNIFKYLKNFISDEKLIFMSRPVSLFLRKIKVIFNENHIITVKGNGQSIQNDQKKSNISFILNKEASMRLWKLGNNEPESPLLFIVDGVIISNPKLKTNHFQSEVTLTNLPIQRVVNKIFNILGRDKLGKRK